MSVSPGRYSWSLRVEEEPPDSDASDSLLSDTASSLSSCTVPLLPPPYSELFFPYPVLAYEREEEAAEEEDGEADNCKLAELTTRRFERLRGSTESRPTLSKRTDETDDINYRSMERRN